MTICGAVHRSAYGARTLVCTLPAGHALPHGISVGGGPPYVRWPVPWTAADERRRQERLAWRKPHVRRPYQTLALWKAAHT